MSTALEPSFLLRLFGDSDHQIIPVLLSPDRVGASFHDGHTALVAKASILAICDTSSVTR